MNEWSIKYLYNGTREDFVKADTLEMALTKWRMEHHNVPGIALYEIKCIK